MVERPPEFAYAPYLLTPHPLKAGREAPTSLFDAIDPSFIENTLYREDERGNDKEILSAADFITTQVHRALWYPKDRAEAKQLGVHLPPTHENILQKQAADCFGFTIVTSECLQASGISHWVGFANGHATVLIGSNKGRRLHLSDPLTPNLSQDITNAVIEGPHDNITRDMQKYGRAAIMLDTTRVVANMRFRPELPYREHPWLYYGELRDEPRRLPSKTGVHKIVMSVLDPVKGRQVLRDYNKLQEAIRERDYEAAAYGMQRIGSFYPDMDARQRHIEIRRVMLELGRQKRVGFARKILRDYFATFDFIDDSRFVEAEGDCLKILGREGKDYEACQEAMSHYERAGQSARAYKQAIKGKLNKVKSFMGKLRVADLPASETETKTD